MNTRNWSMACAIGALTVAMAADFPEHKPGLWLMTITTAGSPAGPVTERICLDARTDQLLYKMGAGMSQKMCSKIDIQPSGGKVVVDTVCHIMNTTTTGHSVTAFVGSTETHTATVSHFDPPMMGKTESRSTQDGKWLGACPADMKPGDVEMSSARMPHPIRMNLNDMMKGAQ